MSQPSIRLIKTPEVNKVLSFLRSKYNVLSEAEIIKLALSEKYQKEKKMFNEEEPSEYFKKELEQALKDREEGKASPLCE